MSVVVLCLLFFCVFILCLLLFYVCYCFMFDVCCCFMFVIVLFFVLVLLLVYVFIWCVLLFYVCYCFMFLFYVCCCFMFVLVLYFVLCLLLFCVCLVFVVIIFPNAAPKSFDPLIYYKGDSDGVWLCPARRWVLTKSFLTLTILWCLLPTNRKREIWSWLPGSASRFSRRTGAWRSRTTTWRSGWHRSPRRSNDP